MHTYPESHVLDRARLTAQELGKIIKNHIPAECQVALLEALVEHMSMQKECPSERLFRTFEAGLVAGVTGQYEQPCIDTIGLPGKILPIIN